MAQPTIISLTLSCMILMCSGISHANPGHSGGSSQNWWDVARGIGWFNAKLTGSVKGQGAKDGKVRTGLGSFRSNLNTTAPHKDPIRDARKSKPTTRKHSGPAKAAPAKHKSASKVETPKELKNLKPPPGVRAIRRVPTRIRR